ncbi:KE2 family protein [Aphelenchoides avenae]|nr:KE2 family protein [Aphelenchus avenae]
MADDDFDAQLRKAFQDLQQQTAETKEKLKTGEATTRAMKQNIRIAELVKSQLDVMPKERPVYRSVGRIFLQETVVSEVARQDEDVRQCTERIAVLAKQKEYLEKNLADAEKNLRELVQSRRG